MNEQANRFEQFLRDEFTVENGWEYGDGDPMTPDCNAFLAELVTIRAQLAASRAEVARLRDGIVSAMTLFNKWDLSRDEVLTALQKLLTSNA